jgi:hypothetical protein
MARAQGTVGLAGAVAFNYLDAPTEAHIDSTGLTITTTGEQKVHASPKNKSMAEADASAVGSGATGVGIAVAANVVDITNKAYVGGTLTLDGTEAHDRGLLPSVTAPQFQAKATAGAKAGTSTDVAGALAVNV